MDQQPPTTHKYLDRLRTVALRRAMQYHAGAAWGVDGAGFLIERLEEELGQALAHLERSRTIYRAAGYPALARELDQYLERTAADAPPADTQIVELHDASA